MASDEWTTVLEPRPLSNFVDTRYTREITERAQGYIAAGFPIHFRGASGTGKTTLAMHLASKIGRPVILIHGDEEHSTSDLVGGQHGYRMKRVVDNFIHSVLKTEENMQKIWVDNRLTVACKHGFTLIYDEFTRSRPEANNVLLSILQEKVMDLPPSRGGYLRVDPNFVAIFTSNPEEYAGVYRSQDALRDRMVTVDLDHPDKETEVAITAAKSGLDKRSSRKVVEIVRGLRDSGKCEFSPTVRGCIMVARTLKIRDGSVDANSKLFRTICMDVLASEASRVGSRASTKKMKALIEELIDRHCRNGADSKRAGGKKAVEPVRAEVMKGGRAC
ncbi:MAG: gas vesicle protein GvpN [Deltaproteobacteria bacterium]|nr:gas vesicle protein GvpN [Deltaproteobacteria bacterium]